MPRPRKVRYPHAAGFATEPPTEMATDGAIDISENGTISITKGSAAALTVAAPGVNNVGREKRIVTATDFAHVVTFTGSTLRDGTTGAKITWTTTAFRGCALMIYAINATTWIVLSKNLGTVA